MNGKAASQTATRVRVTRMGAERPLKTLQPV